MLLSSFQILPAIAPQQFIGGRLRSNSQNEKQELLHNGVPGTRVAVTSEPLSCDSRFGNMCSTRFGTSANESTALVKTRLTTKKSTRLNSSHLGISYAV